MTDRTVMKELDTAPARRWLLENAAGPQNLSGADVIMILDDGRLFVVTVDAPGSAGIVSIDLSDADLAEAVGTHEFEFYVVYADGSDQTFPEGLDRPELVVHPTFKAAP